MFLSFNKSIIIRNKKHLIKLLSNQIRYKYLTQSDIEHNSIVFKGSHPMRPNDPRITFNPLLNQNKTIDEKSDQKKSRKEVISKAMTAYLERAKQYDLFINEQDFEFQMGRRHLANIMGVDESLMTQSDIDLAIQYLMPSGLFDKRARPLMRPPREVYPKKKEAQFDREGRPFHYMFYTGKPNFYETCFEIAENIERLDDFEDRLIRKGVTSAPDDAKIELHSSQWLSYNEMKSLFLEKFDENKYQSLINAFDRLVSHPYSRRAQDFIMKFRKEVKAVSAQMDIPPLMYDQNGRPYMTARGRRKYCIADVIVRGNGTGKVDINGKDILYFECIQDREQVMTPINFCNLLFKVDIECKTMHEEMTKHWSLDSPPVGFVRMPGDKWRELGTTAQSGAIRHGLALALRSFVDKETVEKMRLSGLLTRDVRLRERKKWGQEGARRKYTWKKR